MLDNSCHLDKRLLTADYSDVNITTLSRYDRLYIRSSRPTANLSLSENNPTTKILGFVLRSFIDDFIFHARIIKLQYRDESVSMLKFFCRYKLHHLSPIGSKFTMYI